MTVLLNASKTDLGVVARHYTNMPMWLWLEAWSRGELASLYFVEGDYTKHPTSYGSSWVEVELKLPLKDEVPYKEGVPNQQTIGGWSVDWNRNWFHADKKYIKILSTS